MEIRKVLIRTDGIKYLIIPKRSKIKEGELVLVTNNLKMISKFIQEEKWKKQKKQKKVKKLRKKNIN